MKKLLYSFFIAAAFLTTGCTKNDGPIPSNVSLDRVPQPQIVKNGGSLAIDVLNLGTFKGTFDVGLYFASDVPPSKFDIVVRKNGDNAGVKVFKAGVTTFPTTLNVTAADFATLFGAPVALNDNFDIGADVYTQSGKKFQAFPPGGVAYGSGVGGQPNASTSVRYSAICAYDPSIYQGNFVVVNDDWADYLPGDVIELTKIDDTHFSFEQIATINSIPIVIAVNTGDNSVSVAKQSVGTRWAYGAAYVEPFVLTSGGAAKNFVAPCDKTVTLALDYGYKAGTFGGGPYQLVLVKQ